MKREPPVFTNWDIEWLCWMNCLSYLQARISQSRTAGSWRGAKTCRPFPSSASRSTTRTWRRPQAPPPSPRRPMNAEPGQPVRTSGVFVFRPPSCPSGLLMSRNRRDQCRPDPKRWRRFCASFYRKRTKPEVIRRKLLTLTVMSRKQWHSTREANGGTL